MATPARRRPLKVLLISYEFTHSPFSGNGMLARALARSLLNLGCELLALCARPAAAPGLAADNPIVAAELADDAGTLRTLPVDLPDGAAWRRLDRQSAWEAFAAGVEQHAAAVAQFAPEVAIAIDWTGLTTPPRRRYVSCVVRLSEEKEPMRFARLIASIGAARLAALGLTPLLVGAAADAGYAADVKAALLKASPHAMLIESFLGPTELAAIFASTALNVHPCSYDAYGMTIVEAAAMGTPSLVNVSGTVGASELLAAADGAAFEYDVERPIEGLAEAVHALLSTPERLEAVGSHAKEVALRWNEAAYGEALHAHLEGLLVAPGGGDQPRKRPRTP